jgi:perosamine synthetase
VLIPFEKHWREQYYKLLDDIFNSNFWSEGKNVLIFEEKFSMFCGLPSIAVTNGGAALLSLFTYADVQGREVIVPANTFYATAVAAKMAGANVVYADCNRDDLCVSLDDIKRKVTSKTKAICVVHIGGHIAFQIEAISEFCKENEIVLIEDCAHAHGARFNNKPPGSWGIGGAYSFYATKTMPLGEGGMVSSNDENFLEWAKYYRNYGKKVENRKVSYKIANGFNFRMNEITAALGTIQVQRLPQILSWKKALSLKYDQIFKRRIRFPKNMQSGFYKYIVFDYNLNEETGKVFNHTDFGCEVEGRKEELPNSYWIADHHFCPPMWFGWNNAGKSVNELKEILLNK